jgi:L-aminoadipate-semialdehyde dehydrogenase
VHPYEKLARANVLGTLTAIELVADGKHKSFVLVSSALALHTEHYVRVFDTLVGRPVDNRGRPRVGLPGRCPAYPRDRIWPDDVRVRKTSAQGWPAGTLWVHAVPGLISEWMSTVTNTADFIWCLIEDCVQLGLVPYVNININMTAAPALTVNGLRSSFAWHAYVTTGCEDVLWRRKLEQHAVDA